MMEIIFAIGVVCFAIWMIKREDHATWGSNTNAIPAKAAEHSIDPDDPHAEFWKGHAAGKQVGRDEAYIERSGAYDTGFKDGKLAGENAAIEMLGAFKECKEKMVIDATFVMSKAIDPETPVNERPDAYQIDVASRILGMQKSSKKAEKGMSLGKSVATGAVAGGLTGFAIGG